MDNRNIGAYLKLLKDKKVDVLGLEPLKFKIEAESTKKLKKLRSNIYLIGL